MQIGEIGIWEFGEFEKFGIWEFGILKKIWGVEDVGICEIGFSGFGDFSRLGDFGCLKHITKANHLLSSHSGNEGKTDALRINPHFLKNFSPSLSA